jgi:uncharacterized Zn finger protein (UPF0148 family)
MTPKYCKGKNGNYCSIARPELRQTGRGYEKECPVCGTKYDYTPEPEKLTAEERQKIINRVHNIPVANPGI